MLFAGVNHPFPTPDKVNVRDSLKRLFNLASQKKESETVARPALAIVKRRNLLQKKHSCRQKAKHQQVQIEG